MVTAAVSSFGGGFVVRCWFFFWSLFFRGGGFVVFGWFVCFFSELNLGNGEKLVRRADPNVFLKMAHFRRSFFL